MPISVTIKKHRRAIDAHLSKMEITEDLIHMLRTLETDAKLKEMGFSEEEINQGREIVKNLNIEGSESLQHAQSLIQRMEDMDKRAAEARSKI